MSAEMLRRAASLMRERAEAATNPRLTLALADWLDFHAEVERRLGGPDYETPATHPALAVATIYLEESA